MQEDLSGRLLVATPLLGDPNFRRTVVLVVEDEAEEGTLGVVLNRPTEVPVGQVLESWTDLVTGPSVVFRGGPVAPNSALALAIVPGDTEPVGWRALDGSAVMSRVGLVDLDVPPELLAGGIASLRVFAGYAGWAPGQLQAEIDEGAWYVLSGEPRTPSRPSRSGCGRWCCAARAATSRWWPTIPTIRCSTRCSAKGSPWQRRLAPCEHSHPAKSTNARNRSQGRHPYRSGSLPRRWRSRAVRALCREGQDRQTVR